MSQPTEFTSRVEEALATSPDVVTPEVPSVSAAASRHDGAITVTSDGQTVAVELTDPIRLPASALAAEITDATNEALAKAHEMLLDGLDGSLGAIHNELRGLGTELTASYTAELQSIDERIERLAAQ